MAADRVRAAVLAGYQNDHAHVHESLDDPSPDVRVAALGALRRLTKPGNDAFGDALRSGLDDGEPTVRRRAAELAATEPTISLDAALADEDARVVEMAAWAAGERADPHPVPALIAIVRSHEDALCREAAVASLGALGDEDALPTILHACADKATVRRRAVLSLAAFSGPDVDAALTAAQGDRDWQVRQAAEDLLAIIAAGGEGPTD